MSDKPRLFKTLDDMNVSDIEKGTRFVAVSNSFISGDTVKQGSKITMGCHLGAVNEIMRGEVIPILVLVNKEEYFKLNPDK